ncbi:MAG: hypothetical protein RIS64_2876, partial [Bacteroidota bacterium]
MDDLDMDYEEEFVGDEHDLLQTKSTLLSKGAHFYHYKSLKIKHL